MKILKGDLLSQDTDCLVNPWNMNIIPHWLIVPGGVSGQLIKRAGKQPFRELASRGMMRPGTACMTDGGSLGRPIIHVAGLNLLWRSSEAIVYRCVLSALALASSAGVGSVAMPLIGAGTGGLTEEQSYEAIEAAVSMSSFRGEVRLILWQSAKGESLEKLSDHPSCG